MQDIKSKDGQIRLSLRKIIVLSLIVAIFSVVAHLWEWKQRRVFRHNVKYKTYLREHLEKVLYDFDYMISCKDPYIENFCKKNPEFTNVHNLWILNSHEYWTCKIKSELKRRKVYEI